MWGDAPDSPPEADEAEISVFGPGFGESIVAHLGRGRWVVVDSCMHDQEPAALRYLRRLSVSPSAIAYIIATHWHDDHIRGISTVLDAAESARFVCSGALNRDEFKRVLKAYDVPDDPNAGDPSSGVHEMLTALHVLRRRGAYHRAVGPMWAMEGTALFEDDLAQIRIMSPSQGAMTLAYLELGRLVPRGGPKRRLVAQRPNHLAVTIWLRVGEFAALLGSDLERTGDDHTGWGAVVTSTMRPPGQAAFFKIPHHGSSNADEPRVWAELLVPDCVAVATPFNRGRRALPSDRDCQRLCTRTERVYVTAPVGGQRTRRAAEVEKQIRLTARDLRTLVRPMGQVRVRCRPGASPRVETFGSAWQANTAA